MNNIQIDYNATLKQFFEEVIEYLKKRRDNARGRADAKKVNRLIDNIRRVAANPAMYANEDMRNTLKTWRFFDVFLPVGSSDDTVYREYNSVLRSLPDFFSEYENYRIAARKKLLQSLKTVKYKNSDSVFRDLIYKFKSPQLFAVRKSVHMR